MVSAPPRSPRSRTVFMGTPAYAVPTLEVLLATQDVVTVLTQPDRPAGRGQQVSQSPVKRVALEQGIPVLQPRSLKRDPEAVAAVRDLDPELIVVAAYALILPAAVLDIPKKGALNVHASLLPRWRGAAPVTHAILEGDPETGSTIMLMDEGLDTGPIVAQRRTEIGAEETAGDLTDRLAHLGAELLADTLPAWLNGAIEPRAQAAEEATYAPRLSREDGRVRWTDAAPYIARLVRAMSPWPGAFTELDGRRVKLLSCRPVEAAAAKTEPPGTVVQTGSGPAVVTGDGLLLLQRVQRAGGRPMTGADLARGWPAFVGARLSSSEPMTR